jgi:dsRNA-specific ribonuclease
VRIGDGSSAQSLGVPVESVRAQGRTKKKAEQNAAQSALNILRSQKPSIQE